MVKRALGILGIFVVGIALGIVISLFAPINVNISGSGDVSQKLESLYELVNPGIDASVVTIEEESGLYKVLVKAVDAAGTTNFQEVYITKDGKLLTQSLLRVDESITQLNKIRNFVDCLDNKSVRIAGIVNQTATLLQFNALGGNYAFTKLYFSCDGANAQQCVNAGIIQVPAVIYQNQGYPGVQPISFFENLTACKF